MDEKQAGDVSEPVTGDDGGGENPGREKGEKTGEKIGKRKVDKQVVPPGQR